MDYHIRTIDGCAEIELYDMPFRITMGGLGFNYVGENGTVCGTGHDGNRY